MPARKTQEEAKYIRAAVGVESQHLLEGRCFPAVRSEAQMEWWTKGPNEPGYSKVKAQMAQAECHVCPRQWDCVIYAIRVFATHCIYAVSPGQRDKLAKYPNWIELVEGARAHAVPVAIMIRRLPKYEPSSVYTIEP